MYEKAKQVEKLLLELQEDIKHLIDTSEDAEVQRAIRVMKTIGCDPDSILSHVKDLQVYTEGLEQRTSKEESHYLIYTPYSKSEPVGCCSDKEDALAEEPHAKFEEVEKNECKICKGI